MIRTIQSSIPARRHKDSTAQLLPGPPRQTIIFADFTVESLADMGNCVLSEINAYRCAWKKLTTTSLLAKKYGRLIVEFHKILIHLAKLSLLN